MILNSHQQKYQNRLHDAHRMMHVDMAIDIDSPDGYIYCSRRQSPILTICWQSGTDIVSIGSDGSDRSQKETTPHLVNVTALSSKHSTAVSVSPSSSSWWRLRAIFPCRLFHTATLLQSVRHEVLSWYCRASLLSVVHCTRRTRSPWRERPYADCCWRSCVQGQSCGRSCLPPPGSHVLSDRSGTPWHFHLLLKSSPSQLVIKNRHASSFICLNIESINRSINWGRQLWRVLETSLGQAAFKSTLPKTCRLMSSATRANLKWLRFFL